MTMCAVFLLACAAALPLVAQDLVFEGAKDGTLSLDCTGEKGVFTNLSTRPVSLAAGADVVYSVERRSSGRGTLVFGAPPHAVAYMSTGISEDWRTERMMFRVPHVADAGKLRFSVKLHNYLGKAEFRNPRLEVVTPSYGGDADEKLGFGETLDGNGDYTFVQPFRRKGSHYASRLLERIRNVRANFASSFFFSTPGGEVVFHPRLAAHTFESMEFSMGCEKCLSGTVALQASADGKVWQDVATVQKGKLHAKGNLPASLFPARELYLRLADKPGESPYILVNALRLRARVSGAGGAIYGATRYLDGETGREHPGLTLAPAGRGRYFGETVASAGGLDIWRASSGWRVFRDTPLPKARAAALELKTAANEAESVQLVVRPAADRADVRVTASALDDGAGHSIPASSVDVRTVRYVKVETPSDGLGYPGLWPDPLPPQPKGAFAVKGGENQPFWITVKPPKDTPKGTYRGTLRVSPGEMDVPFEVEVFGFNLPDEMTCKTVFGYGGGDKMVCRYHNAKTESEKAAVRAMYLKAHSDYHLGLREGSHSKIPCRWKGADKRDAWPEFDFSGFDAEMEECIDKYRFNMRRLYPEGLGSEENASLIRDGRGHLVHGPVINGVKEEDDPEAYHRLMGRYFDALKRHLEEKGWLDNVYVHWYDEPQPSDYPALKHGYAIMRRHAPWLKKLLTEQPEKDLLGEPDIWCPLIDQMHSAYYPAARAAGGEFWWYVCNWPRDPYVTDCIDHPALELRTWLWQTWGENVTGIDYWLTVCWTSPAVYKDEKHPQNPYEDPMSWRHNAIRGGFWGNGEAVLFLPPESCAYRTAAGEDFPAVLDEGPVPTMRTAMLRDGLEDYEYFAMLRKADPQNPLLKVPKDVYRTLTDFSIDPANIERHRLRLARAIEAASGK